MEQTILIQAKNNRLYRDPYVDFGSVGIFCRDGGVYIAAKDFKRTNGKSARSRILKILRENGVASLGKIGCVGQISMALMGSELQQAWIFDFHLLEQIPIPTAYRDYISSISVERLISPIEPVICFQSLESNRELYRFYHGGTNEFFVTVLGGSQRIARVRLGKQFPWLKLKTEPNEEVVVLKWVNNIFGYCETVWILDP